MSSIDTLSAMSKSQQQESKQKNVELSDAHQKLVLTVLAKWVGSSNPRTRREELYKAFVAAITESTIAYEVEYRNQLRVYRTKRASKFTGPKVRGGLPEL